MSFLKRKQTLYLILEFLRRPFYKLYLFRRNIKSDNLKIIGKPLIINKGNIEIGKNTKLISSSKFYGASLDKVSLYTIGNNSKIKIGDNCTLHGTSIRSNLNIEIGNNCIFASHIKLIDHDHNINNRESKDYISKEIKIGNNVWVGYNVIILKGATIGENSVIGAGSVVVNDIPKNCIAAGNPAKVIKKL